MKKELTIFLFIFIVFSLFSHFNEFVTNPIEHISNLPKSSVYGLGYLHPFVITFIIYILLWIPRITIKFLKNKSQ
ncbi:hypothetical protein [Arcobacter sp.]|uniref:hypothetical protein n=1 Tax=Arcobacter sp. TaxID=1872629 RepID=UPI003D0FF863